MVSLCPSGASIYRRVALWTFKRVWADFLAQVIQAYCCSCEWDSDNTAFALPGTKRGVVTQGGGDIQINTSSPVVFKATTLQQVCQGNRRVLYPVHCTATGWQIRCSLQLIVTTSKRHQPAVSPD